MKALLLLAALVVGQENGTKFYKVHFEGRELVAEGVMRSDGTVAWYPDTEFNRRAIAASRSPKSPPKPMVDHPYFGVEADKMGQPAHPRVTEAGRRFIAEATEGANVPKLHLTIIGNDQDREAVIGDLDTHPAFAPLKGHLMIQGYRPDHWAIDPKLGFQAGGKPTIIAEQPKGASDPKGGRVVYRAMDYSMGPVALAESLKAEVRRIDPSYDPARDPGPAAGGAGTPMAITSDQLGYILIGAVTLLAFATLPRKEG